MSGWRDDIFAVLQDHDIKQVYHVPDAGHSRLIEACQKPGASVAGLALKAGVNANQLRKWMSLDRIKTRSRSARQPAPASTPAFVPVLEVIDAEPVHLPAKPSLPDAQPAATRRGSIL